MDPVQAYKTLSYFATDEWDRSRQKDKSKFCFDLQSYGAKIVQRSLNELVSYQPFAISDCIEVDYFKNWFQENSIGEWKKLFGDSIIDDDLLKAALMMKRIPIDGLVKIATPALFGKGTETVYDTNVRRAWDITAERLRNGNNNLFIYDIPIDKKICKQIETAMKPKNAIWTYKLYKMHLYGPGDKFLSHVDTLHSSNHVATVVVGLPLHHTGGSLVVKHMDSTVNFNLSNNNTNVAKYCAFFTDCDHEVQEVTSGWRIVLQYDVYQEKKSNKVVSTADAMDVKLVQAADDVVVDNNETMNDVNVNEDIISVDIEEGSDESSDENSFEDFVDIGKHLSDDDEDEGNDEDDSESNDDDNDEGNDDIIAEDNNDVNDDEDDDEDYEAEDDEDDDEDDDEIDGDNYDPEDIVDGEDNHDNDSMTTDDKRSKLDKLLDNWRYKGGSTIKLNKIAIAAPNKNLEDAVIIFLRNKNHNDRLAILFHHYYSLPALQDCILKGTDSVVYDAFASEKWTRKLQGIVIKAQQEEDDDSVWEKLEITPISLEDFGVAEVNGQKHDSCNGTTYLMCYGKDPPRGTMLAHKSDYAGNEERNEFTSYFMTCLVLEYKSSEARTFEVK